MSDNNEIYTPAQLPAKPAGWTRRLVMHMNFGRAGGLATYTIHDDQGRRTPIGYQYDTRKGGLTGYSIPTLEGVMTWVQLVKAWPEFVQSSQIATPTSTD